MNLPECHRDLDRRTFLQRGGMCALLLSLPYSRLALAQSSGAKTRIGLIFAYPDPAFPNWPNIDYDFQGHIQQVRERLKRECPEIDFIVESTIKGSADEGKRILAAQSQVDGTVVYLAGCLWGDLTETIAACGKPTILVDHLFAGSGEFLTSYAHCRRQGYKVAAVSSSDFSDLVQAVRAIDALARLRRSTVLVVGADVDQQIEPLYGARMKSISFAEINRRYEGIAEAKAQKVVDDWVAGAAQVIEPKADDLLKAAKIYLAMLQLLQDHQAQAVTVNCLGGVYSGQMVEAYPCLGFMQLDNDGLVGACEADQRSTITKLLMSYLTQRPGFISDPVIDTSKRQIIYAHCVAATRVFGPNGPANPYHLRSHSEDHKGAAVRSLLPLGEMTTTLLFDHTKKQVIFHQAVTVENIDDDKACRTKLAAEVKGDITKLLTYWDLWGWHRVTFYGDLKQPVYTLASLLGFEVVEEA